MQMHMAILRAMQLNSDLCSYLYLRLIDNVFSKVVRVGRPQDDS